MDLLQCTICDEDYNSSDKKPLVLTCGHTFCKQTVLDWFFKKQKKECPVCKDKVTYINIDEVKVNIAILKIVEQSAVQEKCSSHPTALCDTYCVDCDKRICSKCLKDHKNHELEDYEELVKQCSDNKKEALAIIKDHFKASEQRKV